MLEGLLPEESNEQYHKRPELSSSDIKHMLDSPMHFHRMVIEKHLLPEREPNAAFDLGTCAHECFLIQDTSAFVALTESIDRRTKEGKEKWARFEQDNMGKRIITLEQYEHLMRMFDVIASNPRVNELYDGCRPEVGALYIDPATGLPCKFRPDILHMRDRHITDYKTCMSAAPHEFGKAVARYHYHLSAAHYMAGANVLWPGQIQDYYFIAQEKTEPYAIAIYKMERSDILRSMNFRAELMAKIKEHYESGSWPDWSTNDISLSIPSYAFSFAG
jgi:hypothetical protein